METNSEGTAIWPIEGAIPVVFSIDAEFALPLGVMLGSIVRSNPQTRFDFLVAMENGKEKAANGQA